MIITNLIGGLGNQLFQFAAGLAAAARRHTELRVAVDMFEGYRLHNGYEISRVFEIDPSVASTEEMKSMLGPLRSRATRVLLARLKVGNLKRWNAVFEPTFDYWSGVHNLMGANGYLHGYWQSERYFADHAPAIRAALNFRDPLSPENCRWLERIDNCQSVSVHVRRGDYVANLKNKSIYAACGLDYFLAAMDRIRAAHAGTHFFVFSDDPDWARKAFYEWSGEIEIVDHNRGGASYNDLRLMSLCKHHVVTNSTFSWWAAWLGERPGKIIIAPKRWLNDVRVGGDVVPDRWLRL